jgi:hypothetical protein
MGPGYSVKYDNPTGPPCPGRHDFAESLTEDGLFTFPIATSTSTQPQLQRHPLALNRKILQLPPVTTVASSRLCSARRALRAGAALGTDEPTLLRFVEPQQG